MSDKFYSKENCIRKSDQHWDMAGLARADGDCEDESRHIKLAKIWHERAAQGGFELCQKEEITR